MFRGRGRRLSFIHIIYALAHLFVKRLQGGIAFEHLEMFVDDVRIEPYGRPCLCLTRREMGELRRGLLDEGKQVFERQSFRFQ